MSASPIDFASTIRNGGENICAKAFMAASSIGRVLTHIHIIIRQGCNIALWCCWMPAPSRGMTVGTGRVNKVARDICGRRSVRAMFGDSLGHGKQRSQP